MYTRCPPYTILLSCLLVKHPERIFICIDLYTWRAPVKIFKRALAGWTGARSPGESTASASGREYTARTSVGDGECH